MFFDLEQIKRAVSQIYIFSIIFFLVFCRCGGVGGGENIKKRVFIYGEFCRSSFGILLSMTESHISLFCCSFGCLVCYISCFFKFEFIRSSYHHYSLRSDNFSRSPPPAPSVQGEL